MNNKLIIFFILFQITNISYSAPTITERENFVNYEIDKERSKDLIDFLMIKKLESLENAYQQNGQNTQLFVSNFLKSNQIPTLDKNFVLALRHKSHITNSNALQFLLGVAYTGGFVEGVNSHYNIGFNYLILSATQNNLDAQRELCREYANWMHMPNSLFDKSKWCYIASENGNIKDKKLLEKIKQSISKEIIYIYNNGINAGKEWIETRK